MKWRSTVHPESETGARYAVEDAHLEGVGTPPNGGSAPADHKSTTSEVGTCTDFAPRAQKMAKDRRQKPPHRLDSPNLRQGLRFELGLFMVVSMGLSLATLVFGHAGTVRGWAAALLLLIPLVTFVGSTLAFTSSALRRRGTLVLLYFVVLPTTPLLLTLAACGGRTACLSSEWRGAVWAVGVCVPLGVGAWMVLGSLAHVQRFGFTTMLFVTSTLCGLIMVPVGVILPLWALSTWESFPQFARSDALVTCGVALAVGSTAINFKVAFGLRPKPTMPLITKRVYLALVLVLWLNSCGLQIHALVALRLALMSNRALLLVVTGTLLFLGPATTFACGLPQVSLPSKLNVLVWLGMVVPVTVGLWVPAHGEIHAETRGLLQGVVPFAGGVLCTASAFSNFVGDGARQFRFMMTMHVAVIMAGVYLVGWRFFSLYADEFSSAAAHVAYTTLYFLFPVCAVCLLMVVFVLDRRASRRQPTIISEDFHPQAITASAMMVLHYLLFAVAIILYLTLGLSRARANGGAGLSLAMLLCIPLIFYGLHTGVPRYVVSQAGRVPLRDAAAFALAAAALACAAFFTLYFYGHRVSKNVYWALLTLGIMLPGGIMATMATWTLPKWVRKLGPPAWMSGAALFPTLANAMCVGFLLPLGLVFPLLTIQRLYEDGSATKGQLPNQLVSYVVIVTALTVSTVALFINARMNQMDMELRKEAAIHKIMSAGRTISVILPKPIATIVFDEILVSGKEQAFRVLLSGELLTWLQLGGDAMRMVTTMSLKTKEMLDDLTNMGRLATIKANSSLRLDQSRLSSGPGSSGKGSDKESAAAGDEMVFGDDRLLSMLLGCACFFPTQPPRVHADREPSRDQHRERGKHLGTSGRWSKSTSLMRAKGMMRPTWLAQRNPYGASGSLHLETLPRLFGRFSHTYDPATDLEANGKHAIVQPAPPDGDLNVLNISEYRKLLAFVFPHGLPGHEDQDVYLSQASVKSFDDIPPSVCLLADSSFLTATSAADALDNPKPKPMDFPRFVNAIFMVAEECRKPSRAPQITRTAPPVPLGCSPPLATEPAPEPAPHATPSPERASSPEHTSTSPRRELQPIPVELPSDEQAHSFPVPLGIPGLDQYLIQALRGDDNPGTVEVAERKELLPRIFGRFATPVDTNGVSLVDTNTRELEHAPGAMDVCVLDLHAYRELMGAVFPAGAPGLEAEDMQKGWPSAHDPDGVAPSVYRLSTASFLAVTMSEQGPVPMDYPRFTTGLRLVVAQFSGLEDPPRRRPALLPEAAPVPIELATGGVPEEEDAPDEPEVETKGTSPQCEHVPVPAVAWQQPESKSTPEPPEEDQAAQEAQEPEVHSMIEEESESDDEEAHRVTLLYGKRSQADEQRMSLAGLDIHVLRALHGADDFVKIPKKRPDLKLELLPKLFERFATPTNTDVEALAGVYGGAMFTLAPGATELSMLDMDGYRALVGCVFPAGIPGMEAADAAKGFLSSSQPGTLAPSVQRLATASFISVTLAKDGTNLPMDFSRFNTALSLVVAKCSGPTLRSKSIHAHSSASPSASATPTPLAAMQSSPPSLQVADEESKPVRESKAAAPQAPESQPHPTHAPEASPQLEPACELAWQEPQLEDALVPQAEPAPLFAEAEPARQAGPVSEAFEPPLPLMDTPPMRPRRRKKLGLHTLERLIIKALTRAEMDNYAADGGDGGNTAKRSMHALFSGNVLSGLQRMHTLSKEGSQEGSQLEDGAGVDGARFAVAVGDETDSSSDEEDVAIVRPRRSAMQWLFGACMPSGGLALLRSAEAAALAGEGGEMVVDLSKPCTRPPHMDWKHCIKTIVGAVKEADLTSAFNHKAAVATVDRAEARNQIYWYSVPNMAAVFGLVTEFYMNTMFAFTPMVLRYWGISYGTMDTAANAATFQVLNWHLRTILCISLCLFYSAFAWPAVAMAKNGTLGKGPDGKAARLGTGPWWYMQVLSVLGNIGYQPLLLNLLAITVCREYDGLLVVSGTSDLVCWSGHHMWYVSIGLFTGLVFYPAATILFPNFQFLDSTLDIKYSPSFLLQLLQAKLVLAYFKAYWGTAADNSHTSATVLLSVSLVVFCGQALSSHLMQPCLARHMNIVRTLSFSASAIAQVASLVMVGMQMDEPTLTAGSVKTWHQFVGLAVIAVGWCALGVYCVYSWIEERDRARQRRAQLRARLFGTKKRAQIKSLAVFNRAFTNVKHDRVAVATPPEMDRGAPSSGVKHDAEASTGEGAPSGVSSDER